MPTVQTDLAHIGEIDVPVLVLAGAKDAFFPPPAVEKQTALLTGSQDVSGVVIPDTGHALTLHLSRDMFQSEIAMWLTGHGFADDVVSPSNGLTPIVAQGLISLSVRPSQVRSPTALMSSRSHRSPSDVIRLAFGGGPILFVPPCDGLPGAVAQEIQRLDPSNVVALNVEGMGATVCEATIQAANAL